MVERVGHCSVVSLSYESLPEFCVNCHIVGHHINNCRQAKRQEESNKDDTVHKEKSNDVLQKENSTTSGRSAVRTVNRDRAPVNKGKRVETEVWVQSKTQTPLASQGDPSTSKIQTHNSFDILGDDSVGCEQNVDTSSNVDLSMALVQPSANDDKAMVVYEPPPQNSVMITTNSVIAATLDDKSREDLQRAMDAVLTSNAPSEDFNALTVAARKRWSDMADEEEQDNLEASGTKLGDYSITPFVIHTCDSSEAMKAMTVVAQGSWAEILQATSNHQDDSRARAEKTNDMVIRKSSRNRRPSIKLRL